MTHRLAETASHLRLNESQTPSRNSFKLPRYWMGLSEIVCLTQIRRVAEVRVADNRAEVPRDQEMSELVSERESTPCCRSPPVHDQPSSIPPHVVSGATSTT
jgi:hypothetical protein